MTDCTLCDEPISQGRRSLGYVTCLGCGEAAANELTEQRKKQIAPVYNKGAYQVIPKDEVKHIGK